MDCLGAELNGVVEDRKSQLHGEEYMHGELGFGRKGGECRLSRKRSFGEGVKGSENLVWNFVREEEGGKLFDAILGGRELGNYVGGHAVRNISRKNKLLT